MIMSFFFSDQFRIMTPNYFHDTNPKRNYLFDQCPRLSCQLSCPGGWACLLFPLHLRSPRHRLPGSFLRLVASNHHLLESCWNSGTRRMVRTGCRWIRCTVFWWFRRWGNLSRACTRPAGNPLAETCPRDIAGALRAWLEPLPTGSTTPPHKSLSLLQDIRTLLAYPLAEISLGVRANAALRTFVVNTYVGPKSAKRYKTRSCQDMFSRSQNSDNVAVKRNVHRLDLDIYLEQER